VIYALFGVSKITHIDYSAFLNLPQSSVEPGSKFYVKAELACFYIRYRLFSTSPLLSEGYNHDDIFNVFLSHAYSNQIKLDWKLHLEFAKWISKHADLNGDAARECIISSASQWTYYDKSVSNNIVIRSIYLNDELIVATKMFDPVVGRKIYQYKASLPPCNNLFEFQICDSPNEIRINRFIIL
jgi:hypothetical protein